MCGACRQLGPVLHSTAAEGHGLKTSLLEAFVHFHASQQQHYADLGLAPCLGLLHPPPLHHPPLQLPALPLHYAWTTHHSCITPALPTPGQSLHHPPPAPPTPCTTPAPPLHHPCITPAPPTPSPPTPAPPLHYPWTTHHLCITSAQPMHTFSSVQCQPTLNKHTECLFYTNATTSAAMAGPGKARCAFLVSTLL